MSVEDSLKQALMLQRSGQRYQAVSIYRRVLAREPDHHEAMHWLGVAAYQAGQHLRALECIRAAVAQDADNSVFQCNLGLVYVALGELDAAEQCFRRAIELAPEDSPSKRNLAALRRQRASLLAECVTFRSGSLQMWTDASAYTNLGIASRKEGQTAKAISCYREALRLDPDNPAALNCLGNALKEQGRLDEAADCYHQALRLRPDYSEAFHNLGAAYGELGRTDEAQRCYRRALELRPDYALAGYGLAHALLLAGDFAQGWEAYQWRWQLEHFTLPRFEQPPWDGTPAPDKTILLFFEQGLGDTIEFVRYAPMVKQRAAHVVLACQGALVPLVSLAAGRLHIDQVVAAEAELPPFDLYATLLDLPRLFRTTLATIPTEIPYLSADPQRVEDWRQRLDGVDGYRVGINWHGGTQNRRNLHRFFGLEQLAPLAEVSGVRLVSLQKGTGRDQLARFGGPLQVVDFGEDFDQAAGALMDSAAVMKNLDLVVTCDTSVAHLAGALGVPVWVALAFAADWRWMLHREDTPWYPTVRLFRQPRPGHWDEVFERMARELTGLVAAATEHGSGRPREEAIG